MIDLNQVLVTALISCVSEFVTWKLIDITIVRCEKVSECWVVEIRNVYLKGDCIVFVWEISLAGNINSYRYSFVELPPQFQYLKSR